MRSRAPLIGALVALVIAVAFFFLLYQPRDRDLDGIRTEIADLETQRSTLENEISHLREIESRELEFRAALARLEEYIPAGVAQSALIRQFQLAADESGVVIALVAFGEPEPLDEAPTTGMPGTVLGAIPVSMTVEGGYFQVVDFMRRVEVEVPRAILVETLSIVEGPDEFPQLSSTWNGQLFAVVPDTAVSSQDGAEGGDGEAGEAGDAGADAGADGDGAGEGGESGPDGDGGQTAADDGGGETAAVGGGGDEDAGGA